MGTFAWNRPKVTNFGHSKMALSVEWNNRYNFYAPQIPQKCCNWLLNWAFCINQRNFGQFPLFGFLGRFFAVFRVLKRKKFKCNAEDHFWSMRLNSRCFGVPRTRTTTIFGCSLKIPMLRNLHPPKVPSFLDEDYYELQISIDLDRLLLGENYNDDFVFFLIWLGLPTQVMAPRLASATVWELIMMTRMCPGLTLRLPITKAESAKVYFNNGLWCPGCAQQNLNQIEITNSKADSAKVDFNNGVVVASPFHLLVHLWPLSILVLKDL